MAGTGRVKAELVLSEDERVTLERWARRPKSAQRLAQRSTDRVGVRHGSVEPRGGARISVSPRPRWASGAAASWPGASRGSTTSTAPGCRAASRDEVVENVIVKTLEEMPKDATHWSTRSLAEAVGISPASVQRIWGAFGLQPWRTESFKLSTDPLFIEKVKDVVGSLPRPARARRRPRRRREVPDPGAQPLPARLAHGARARQSEGTHDYTASRHHLALRRPLHPRRHRHHLVAQTPPGHRVQEVPRAHRRRGPRRPRRPPHRSTTTPPTRPRPSSAGWLVTRDSICTSSPPDRAGSTSSSAGSPS